MHDPASDQICFAGGPASAQIQMHDHENQREKLLKGNSPRIRKMVLLNLSTQNVRGNNLNLYFSSLASQIQRIMIVTEN